MADQKLDNVNFAYLPEYWQAADANCSIELSLGEALELFLKKKAKKSPRTLESYQSRIGSFLAHLGEHTRLNSVTLADLRLWQETLEERTTRYDSGKSARPRLEGGLSPVTVREHVRAVKIFFNWLFDQEIMETNPTLRLKMPSADVEQKEGITTADLLEMCQAARYSGHPRDYAMLLFFRDTRCRLGGAVGLTLPRLWVNKQECKLIEKGNKKRTIWFLEDTQTALREWLTVRPKVKHDCLFVGKTGEPLQDNGFYRVFETCAKRVKVTGEWNPHAWRHWGSRQWELAGMPDSVRAQLLGHSLKGMGVTAGHYSRLSDEALRELYFQYTKRP